MISSASILAALVLGFSGSLHCVGMCGPLSVGLLPGGKAGMSTALYFLGKTITYGLLGLFFGMVGRTWVLAGWQQHLSIVAGVLLLLIGLFTFFSPRWFHTGKLGAGIAHFLQPAFAQLLKLPTNSRSFGIGLLNGLLPCGLVYMGIAGSLSTGSAVAGSLFMVIFGLATAPFLAAFILFRYKLPVNMLGIFKKWSPMLIAVLGIILVLRGMALGIPYISPQLPSGPALDSLNHCG